MTSAMVSAADIGVIEHEGVARVVAHGLDARNQLVIDDARGVGFPACPCARRYQRNQIDQAIGYRRIDGVADRLGIDPLQNPTTVGVSGTGCRWPFAIGIDFGEDCRAPRARPGRPANSTSTISSKLNQPERQLSDFRGLSTSGAVAEAAAVIRCGRRAGRCAGSGRDLRISFSRAAKRRSIYRHRSNRAPRKCLESISPPTSDIGDHPNGPACRGADIDLGRIRSGA